MHVLVNLNLDLALSIVFHSIHLMCFMCVFSVVDEATVYVNAQQNGFTKGNRSRRNIFGEKRRNGLFIVVGHE